MKILFLSHFFYPSIGGIEINSEILATEWSNLGHEVRMLTWTETTERHSFPFQIIRNPTVNEILKQHSWAEVIFENHPCLKLSWPAFFSRKPSVVAINIWLTRPNGRRAFLDYLKLLRLNSANIVISVSSAIRKKCWRDSIVIGNPYREKVFFPIQSIPRNRTFVFVGRLVSDKGVHIVLSAIHYLVEKYKQNKNLLDKVSLTVIGSGPEKVNLYRIVSNLGLESHVRFIDFLNGPDLNRYLNQHRCILVPSVWEEPFGNVVLEGMACRCLPIVTDGGGLPEAVGDAGIIVKRNSLDEIVIAMSAVIEDPKIIEKYSEKIVSHLTKHSVEKVSLAYLNLLVAATNEG